MAKLVSSHLWAEPIGRAFLAFGSIEHSVVIALQDIPADRVQKAAIRMALAARIDLMVEILEGYPGDAYAALSVALREAKELSKTRNVIAHNPLVLEFYETDEGNFLTNEVIAVLHKEGHKLSLTELNEFVAKAEALAEHLYACLARIRGERLMR